MAKRKYAVNRQFRKSNLSHQDSPITAEVHFEGSDTKIYDNVHYPNPFANKIFNENSNATHVIFRDSSEDSMWTVNRPS